MGDPPSPTGTGHGPVVTVVASDEQNVVAVDTQRWSALAVEVLRAERCRGEMTLTFVDSDEMAALNAEHMGVTGPTDVLSFPLDPFGSSGPAPCLIGDVVICPSVAAAAAPTHAGTVDDELALLTVHGVLHVTGHDHAGPDETVTMRARERELLETLHWHGPAPAGFRHDHHDPAAESVGGDDTGPTP